MRFDTKHIKSIPAVLAAAALSSCSSGPAEGLLKATPATTTVELDFDHRPLPEIPLPNDLATRFDPTSPTTRRINASMIAPTSMERRVRQLADQLDGWGVFQTITIPFTGPLDIDSVMRGHRDPDYDPSNDVVYLINVDRKSERFGQLYHLDVGNGNYPVVLEKGEYWKNDPRGDTLSLTYEETDEDINKNGKLDPGEDTDADGVLDVPNYLPGMNPDRDDLAGRADALMSFYERQTNSLIVKPLIPLDERTTYAVVVTRRILDQNGEPVGSPFDYINHTAQTQALEPLLEVLPDGLEPGDIAFAWTFSTQTIETDWQVVRDGLYGHGIQGHLGKDFPAELSGLEELRDKSVLGYVKNTRILYTEDALTQMVEAAEELFDFDLDGQQGADFINNLSYIDYHIVGTFESPQLFERTDADGNWLPEDSQSWPPDISTTPAKARSETVYFWLTVPRKEVSVRAEGKPVPLVVVSHGYTSSRVEMIAYAGEFARHGIASISIDCVSHGLGLTPIDRAIVENIFNDKGFSPFLRAMLKDRGTDLNNDNIRDPGADFWTSYLFHTRDVVRQSVVDHMQLLRILRRFDGTQTWNLDINGDGNLANDLAGDFDGDGVVDVGGPDITIGMTGGSLGGIMSIAVGAMEPALDVTVPVAGGGGLSDVGIRSRQGGVREAVILRLLGPLFVGTMSDAGELVVETIIPDLTDDVTLPIAKLPGIEVGDTMVITNLANGERGCGYISAEGTVRAGIAADTGDHLRIDFYDGNALRPEPECIVGVDRTPKHSIESFGERILFQREEHKKGEPLIALTEGYGLRRAHPDLRRFLSLSQLVLDPADPGVLARNLLSRPLTYPATGEQTGVHTMVVTTVGDMNVPASTGGTIGRATGLIDYLNPDPRYGKPLNQVLIDTYTYEAVNGFKRFEDPNGEGVHIDVENFSDGDDLWTGQIPRLDPPLRIGMDHEDPFGGVSTAIFPYPKPDGAHGFPLPGEEIDKRRKECRRTCEGEEACQACETATVFDTGRFMFNMLGEYFKSGGKAVTLDRCHAFNACDYELPVPPERSVDIRE